MNPTPIPRSEKPVHASGRRFVAGLGIGFVVLAVGLYAGLKAFVRRTEAQRPPPVALAWDERDRWTAEPVQPFELEYDSMVQAETGKRYRNAVFALAADPAEEKRIERALLDCAALARDPRAFAGDGARAFLETKAAAFPGQFYPAYLLASWHALHGDPARYEAWMTQAAAVAPAFLMETGHAPDRAAAPVAIAFDRLRTVPKADPSFVERLAHHTKDQILDRDLVLVYPAPLADDQGRVWLPVFRDMYRWADPKRPTYPADGAHDGHGTQDDWFSMGGARVGRLDGPGANPPKRP